ncbi:uncharacterized protein [Panulirus ornatus]|uniref:uncharacterized protein isoform X4 n=1 Tax=Panulirus ornatus TaxID=150431 RepID=UPI003A879EE5
MLSMASIEIWKPLEEATWYALPGMGPQWMGKSYASNQGYMIMLSDGCCLWGENRGAKYILDKAEDWAPCIEAGIKEVSSLVLVELTKLNVKTGWTGDRQNVNIIVSSRLNDMSYRWEFKLDRLSDELFGHHWVTPLMVQVQHLGLRVKHLTAEVEQKRRLLEELLPENKSSSNKSSKTTKSKDNFIESAVETVLVSGAWTVLQDHLVNYPQIMKHLANVKSHTSENNGDASAPKTGKNLPIDSRKGNQKDTDTGELDTEAETEERKAEEERKRRVKIQELTRGTDVPALQTKKKKKKLNL